MPNEIHVSVPGRPDVLRFTETVRIGRAPTNGIEVAHELVSTEHAELRPVDEGWELVDLGSTNGTYLDGRTVRSVTLGAATTVQLGRGGPKLLLTIPAHVSKGGTKKLPTLQVVERYISTDAPEEMSSHTAMIRAAFRGQLDAQASTWLKRIHKMRVAIGVLLVLAAGAGGVAIWQARRANALRTAAAAVFNTMKSLELDVRRLESRTGPDSAIAVRRRRLERQYEDLVKTLGIYSGRTPADVQLIYRIVHRLGESEANVPRGFVDEVRRFIAEWKAVDLKVGLDRANAQQLGPQVSAILLEHHLPREFFYLALQESKFDPRAIGPNTRLGVPKGLWQLIPPTAESYGLRLGPLRGERSFDPNDERHDVAKATAAAARYLEDIYTTDAQASGLLVIASYNMGETRLRALLRSLPESPSERNFWALLKHHRREIPTETYNYVFRVVSAAVIGADPKLFGFDLAPPLGVMPVATSGEPTN